MKFTEKVKGGADIYHEGVEKVEDKHGDDNCLLIHYKDDDKDSKHVHEDFDGFEIVEEGEE